MTWKHILGIRGKNLSRITFVPLNFKSCNYILLTFITVLLLLLSCFSHAWLFATPWTVAHQAPWSMGFSRQEYWSRLLCLPPGFVTINIIKTKKQKLLSFNDFLMIFNIVVLRNAVLISAVQLSDLVMHVYILFLYSFPLWFITGDWI